MERKRGMRQVWDLILAVVVLLNLVGNGNGQVTGLTGGLTGLSTGVTGISTGVTGVTGVTAGVSPGVCAVFLVFPQNHQLGAVGHPELTTPDACTNYCLTNLASIAYWLDNTPNQVGNHLPQFCVGSTRLLQT